MGILIVTLIGTLLAILFVLFRIAVVVVPFIFMGALIYKVWQWAYRIGKRQERKERRLRRWKRIRAERERKERETRSFHRPA